MKEKERFEVLLEEIRDSVKKIAEGHDALRQEMKSGFDGLKQEVSELRSQFQLYAKHTSARLAALESK